MGIDMSSLNALLAQAKNMVSTGPRSSALCQHANEVPRGPCSCPQTCYCKQDGGCGGNRQWQMSPPNPRWLLSRAEQAMPHETTWKEDDTPAGLTLAAWPPSPLQNVSLSLDTPPPGWTIESIDASPRRLGVVCKHSGGQKVLLTLHFDPLPDTDTGFWQKLTDPDSL